MADRPWRSTDYETLCGALPDVRVKVGSRYNAATNPKVEKAVDEEWERRKRANPSAKLFNGLKFRFHSIDDGALCLGLTDYKSYIGTHYMPDETFAECSKECTGVLSNALGVEAMVVTADGHAVLFRRSDKVAEYPGFYCLPGGHAEPGKVYEAVTGSPPPDDKTAVLEVLGRNEGAVRDEVIGSILDEVHEEIGVPRDSLAIDGVLGVVANTRTRGKPDVLFLVRCALPQSEVQRLYDAGHATEQYESDHLLFLPTADRGRLEAMVSENRVTPPSAAALLAFLGK
eukprot:Sspe_Gene.113848::Locus_98624_Transcript_1_1_Confidence_1.000_Length_1008::g.113848::m.113848